MPVITAPRTIWDNYGIVEGCTLIVMTDVELDFIRLVIDPLHYGIPKLSQCEALFGFTGDGVVSFINLQINIWDRVLIDAT